MGHAPCPLPAVGPWDAPGGSRHPWEFQDTWGCWLSRVPVRSPSLQRYRCLPTPRRHVSSSPSPAGKLPGDCVGSGVCPPAWLLLPRERNVKTYLGFAFIGQPGVTNRIRLLQSWFRNWDSAARSGHANSACQAVVITARARQRDNFELGTCLTFLGLVVEVAAVLLPPAPFRAFDLIFPTVSQLSLPLCLGTPSLKHQSLFSRKPVCRIRSHPNNNF
ncbi:ADP-ribosylation factor-like protein 15 isoform X5 [Corapipo altera]|uniref:ADP-ribosylation factor-like protein 15 isoform X5 n=1 Tax=Corapipo altera TaxID=415028 RepID=UPI000FD657F2|nr:ADP-ribosylation factor-like protein 15 isoform X5 [Corapipo altera]